MKLPTAREKFMDYLRATLEDAIPAKFERSYLVKRYIGNINGKDQYIEYTAEEAPQLLNCKLYGGKNTMRVEFVKGHDSLRILVDGEYRTSLDFSNYKNKTSLTVAVALWFERFCR